MFNSPINPLFGILPTGKDSNSKQKQNKDNKKQKNDDSKNFFEMSDGFEELVVEDDMGFDPEKFIRNYLESLKEEYAENNQVLEKIDVFLNRFELKKFYKKYGNDLSKEDLKTILFEIVQEFLS